MFGWLEEFYRIRRENRELNAKPCEACEVLKVEISNLRRENTFLLSHALSSKTSEPERMEAPAPQPLSSRHVPWRVTQQKLETEDRIKAADIRRQFEEKIAEAERNVTGGQKEAGV
jgi:hypothetical protein